jgi:hypothetical protein
VELRRRRDRERRQAAPYVPEERQLHGHTRRLRRVLLKIGKHTFRIKKGKGKKISVTVGKKGKYGVSFSPKYGNVQTRKAKVKS